LDPIIALLSDEGKIEDYSTPIIASIADELRTRAANRLNSSLKGFQSLGPLSLPNRWVPELVS